MVSSKYLSFWPYTWDRLTLPRSVSIWIVFQYLWSRFSFVDRRDWGLDHIQISALHPHLLCHTTREGLASSLGFSSWLFWIGQAIELHATELHISHWTFFLELLFCLGSNCSHLGLLWGSSCVWMRRWLRRLAAWSGQCLLNLPKRYSWKMELCNKN